LQGLSVDALTEKAIRERIDFLMKQPNGDELVQQYIAALKAAEVGGAATTGATTGGAAAQLSLPTSGGATTSSTLFGNLRSRNAGWWDAFTKAHGGESPVSNYTGTPEKYVSDDEAYGATREAEWDRAWGDQFARMHGRGPTDEEWADSYYQRNSLKRQGAAPWGGPWEG